MTTFALPLEHYSNYVTAFSMRMVGNVHINQSVMNKAMRTVEFPGDYWIINVEYRPMHRAEFQRVRAFWNRLRGQAHRVRVWNMANGPVPQGTLRGTPSVNAAAVQGANTVQILGSPAWSLKQGDMIGVTISGSTPVVQLVEVAADTLTLAVQSVSINPPLRRAATAGALVTWSMPYVDCIVVGDLPDFEQRSVLSEGFSIQLMEVPT